MTKSQNTRTAGNTADVVILGAGPAGLLLANLLHREGIDCAVLERATPVHIRTRARAGFLAANTVRILDRHGLSGNLHRDGRLHGSCEFRTDDGHFRLDYAGLGLREQHTVYPQQDLVGDLLDQYLDAGGRVHFETEALAVHGIDGPRPTVTVRTPDGGGTRSGGGDTNGTAEWAARYVAGCDGRYGASRRSLPPTARHHRRDHGVSWLGLIAEAPPSLDAVGYALHGRGFAGHMARTPQVTRYYLQCERGTRAGELPEERIWDELDTRMRAPEHGPLHRGRILQRAVVDLESDVVEPLRHGSLLLAGDAAGLISPAAAKGANLAVLEAELLARALVDDLAHGDGRALERYSAEALERVWRAQEFSHWMVQLLHARPGPSDDESFFHESIRRARIASLRTSRSHQDWFAENYVGI
ncbi:Rossmann-fold NAD(P)(+)-binding protein [Kitasatospora sp. Ki12]